MEDNMRVVIEAARLGVAATKLEAVGSFAHYALPTTNGVLLGKISLEEGRGVPFRPRGTVKVFDAASFSAILDANQEAGEIAVYVNRDAKEPAIVGVLNGNGISGAGWGDFRVEIAFRPTPQWTKWKAIDGTMMPQTQFAEFIEDNLEDVVDPVAGQMLEIATYLQATRTVNFKSGLRLSSGLIQFINEQSEDAKVGSGKIDVPETITLALAPVFGLPPYRIPTRFRYRLSQDGKLTLGIKMQRVDDLIATIVQEMVHGVPASEGRVPVSGIVLPDGALLIEGIAPTPTK